jgi:hypothetical protein
MLLVVERLLGTAVVVPLVRRVVTETPRKASAVCQPEKHCFRSMQRAPEAALQVSVDTFVPDGIDRRTGSHNFCGHTINGPNESCIHPSRGAIPNLKFLDFDFVRPRSTQRGNNQWMHRLTYSRDSASVCRLSRAVTSVRSCAPIVILDPPTIRGSINTHVVGQTRALVKRVSRIGLTPLYATLSLQTEPERWDLFSPLEIVHA